VNTRSKFSGSEVISFQEQLNEIKAIMKDGNFIGPDGTPLNGQEIVEDLLGKCLKWSEIVLERYGFYSFLRS
jgi:hypothetical protein